MTTKIGCCGFPVSRPKYFGQFEVVEIQQTFYNLPQLKTAEKWAGEAPERFEFTAKAWQLITHEPSSPTYRRLKTPIEKAREKHYGGFKPTDEVAEAWNRCLEFFRVLGVEKVVFQCPAGFRPTPGNKKNIRNFFSTIDRTGFTCIWEPRGEWKEEEIRRICEQCSLAHCVDPFQSRPQAGAIRYFRLHGVSGYRYRYSDSDLRALSDHFDSGLRNYVMFNNMSMFEDASRLKSLLEKSRR